MFGKGCGLTSPGPWINWSAHGKEYYLEHRVRRNSLDPSDKDTPLAGDRIPNQIRKVDGEEFLLLGTGYLCFAGRVLTGLRVCTE